MIDFNEIDWNSSGSDDFDKLPEKLQNQFSKRDPFFKMGSSFDADYEREALRNHHFDINKEILTFNETITFGKDFPDSYLKDTEFEPTPYIDCFI